MKTLPRILRSLSVRLALTYAVLFAVSFAIIALVSYLALSSTLLDKLDRELGHEVTEYFPLLDEANMAPLDDALTREAMSEGIDHMFLRVLTADHQEVASSDMRAWGEIEVDEGPLKRALNGERVYETHHYPEHEYPVRVAYAPFGPGYVIQIGISTEDNAHIMGIFRSTFGFASTMFFICALALGALMTHGAVRRVRGITSTARDISAGDWSSRVPISGRADELDDLAKAFNEMIHRVAQLLSQVRRVSDDIAHDLRTPITRIRGTAEGVLNASTEGDGRLAPLGEILLECDQLDYMIDTMLQIARMEEGIAELDREVFDLTAVVADVIELFEPSAEEKSIALRLRRPDQALQVYGERQMIERVVAHLLDNAVKYTEGGGTVDVTCETSNGFVEVRVADTGPGIPAEQRELIFERFHRVEQSRNAKGYGLGLSISRAIARAHGGDIRVESTVGKGSVFVLRLPVSSASNSTSAPEPAVHAAS